MNELEQDKRYVFGDMIIVASIDANSNPILKISTDAGNVVVMPSSDNKKPKVWLTIRCLIGEDCQQWRRNIL